MSSDRRQDQRRVHILRQADPRRERIFPCVGRASSPHVSRQRLHECSVTSTTRPANSRDQPGYGSPVTRPTRTPAARHTTGTPGARTPDHGRPPLTHRPQASTAIRWPRATPPRIPPRGRRNKGIPNPEDVPPAVATTGITSTCCPGPTARCVRHRTAREAPFRNMRRSTNVGDAEVDA